MLLLFLLEPALPRFPLRILNRAPAAVPATSPDSALILDQNRPVDGQRPSVSATPRPIDWKEIVVIAYGTIALAFLAHFVTGIFLARRLLATAHPVAGASVNDAWESARIAVPLTVGWLRPRILLPSDWREWEAAKLNAVLVHERAHVRRHDGLVAALAGLNRCIFWFHPLAWFLQRKLMLLAEQACDESCVAELGNRQWYARLLVEMASVVDPSRGRLRYHALTMATGSHIHQRIDALLQNRRSFSRGLTWRGWAAVIICGAPVVLGAAAVELDRQRPPLRLAMPHWAAPAPPLSTVQAQPTPSKPIQMVQVRPTPTPSTLASAYTPNWDSVSIKPCAAGDGAGRSGRGGAGGRGMPLSPPGDLFVNCMSVRELIDHTIGRGQEELLNDFGGPFEKGRIRGGPSWVYSDLYTIDAKSSDPAVNQMDGDRISPASRRLLSGPMLQALIVSRFQLKTHREVEEIPVFSLAVANGGFKLRPMEEGGCIPHEPGTPFRSSPGQKPSCITHTGWEGPNWTIDAAGQGMDNLAGALSGMITDRPVLNKTGITGLFSFHLAFAHDKDAPGTFPPGFPSPFPPTNVAPGPSLNTVLEQELGLTLKQETGPHEFIVIDSAERPRQN
jgi:uncharacterized protein (TIGR03435 family)